MKTFTTTLLIVFFCITKTNAQTYVPDDNFEQALIELGYDSVLDDYVNTFLISNITTLDVSSKNIADLTGIEDFESLEYLYCVDNLLTSLDLSNNTELNELYCGANQLTSLDVSNNPVLYLLNCSNNQLTYFDVSSSVILDFLVCNDNQLTSLALTNNTELTILDCFNNQLTSLDLSNNTELFQLRSYNNQLTSLNIKNGNNTNLNVFDVTNNPTLTCIQVDDAAYSTTNWTDIDPQSYFSQNCNYPQTFVPHNNFELALIELGYDAVFDNYVTTSNINSTPYLDISFKNISDLTGIEDFTALTELYCFNNNLTNLDLSNNLSLTTLYCYNNQLTSLNLSNNTALIDLKCHNNQLTSLDVSNNTDLNSLGCSNNQLTSLDISNNQSLNDLYCSDNQLTSLDVSNNTELTVLSCFNNQLTILNVKNGNNNNMTAFNSTNNPNLTCIQVDDAVYSTNNWTNIDPQSYFSESCYTYVPDDNFEQVLIDLGYDDVLDNYVFTENINSITNLDVSNKNIADLAGIEGFTALINLNCSSNVLTDINLQNNTNLSVLLCQNNQLTGLNLSNNTALTIVRCGNNQLTNLNVSNNTLLTEIKCQSNQLTGLNIRNNNNTNISNTNFNATNNPNLTCIFVDDATWSTVNWTNIDPSSTFVETQAQCESLSVEEMYLYEFTIYPNPAKDFLTIESNINTTARLYSITGKLLLEKNIQQGTNLIDLALINNGLYFLRIENQIKRVVIK